MFKTDSLIRYKEYLNEMIYVAKLGKLEKPAIFRAKYGVSAALLPFLRQKGVFTYDSKNKIWHTNRTTHFDIEEVSMLKNEFNRSRYVQRTTGKKEDNPPVRDLTDNVNPEDLSQYSVKELIAELRKRGYAGEIFIEKRIKF